MADRILALSAVLALAAAGCGVLPAAERTAPASSAPATSAPAATVTASDQDTRPALAVTRSTMTEHLKVEVVGLNRVEGRHLIAQIRLSNTGTDQHLSWPGELGDRTRPLGAIKWASGIGVLDTRARAWLLPYVPVGSPCLCSDLDRDGLGRFIDPGRSVTVYAVLPAPSGNPPRPPTSPPAASTCPAAWKSPPTTAWTSTVRAQTSPGCASAPGSSHRAGPASSGTSSPCPAPPRPSR
ncbi:hypothetical protein AB0M50_30510 [Nonomuraea fuscirosea]|uniref:hypothetical protein n=1 Tax=Nonomuraea fuscirosea TaxID=1291556 RepID=UPI00344480AB